jgi:hypothetical protein
MSLSCWMLYDILVHVLVKYYSTNKLLKFGGLYIIIHSTSINPNIIYIKKVWLLFHFSSTDGHWDARFQNFCCTWFIGYHHGTNENNKNEGKWVQMFYCIKYLLYSAVSATKNKCHEIGCMNDCPFGIFKLFFQIILMGFVSKCQNHFHRTIYLHVRRKM